MRNAAVMRAPTVWTGCGRPPRVLVVTPEISGLPPGMGDHARGVATRRSGLADMTAALVASLFDLGIDVHVAVPNYMRLFGKPGNGLDPRGRTQMCKLPGSRLHLAEDRMFTHLVDIDSYAPHGDLRAALVFQREIINRIVPWVQPDIIHCHDWMTGLIPAMAQRRGIHCIFTIHNPVLRQATLAEIEEAGIDAAEFWSHLYYQRWPGNYETTRPDNPVDFLASAVFAADYVHTSGRALRDRILRGNSHGVTPAVCREIILKAVRDEAWGIPVVPVRRMRAAPDHAFDRGEGNEGRRHTEIQDRPRAVRQMPRLRANLSVRLRNGWESGHSGYRTRGREKGLSLTAAGAGSVIDGLTLRSAGTATLSAAGTR